MLKEKAKAINTLMTMVDIILAIVCFNLALYLEFGRVSLLHHKDSIILQLLIIIFWTLLSNGMGTNIMYRSRPYSAVLFNCLGLTIAGTLLLILSAWAFNLFYLGVKIFLIFAVINLVLTFGIKTITYQMLKSARKKGLNYLNLIIVGDRSAVPFIRQLMKHPEWGYRIAAIIGTNDLENQCGTVAPFLPDDTDIENLLREKTIDEVVVCKESPNLGEIEELAQICSDVGVIFRMYSSFFNMLANKTQLHFFGTTPFLTISNSPTNYLELKGKEIFDRLFSFGVLLFLSPVYLAIALAIKLDSKGPVFFKQKRVGLRGRKFLVYKFRTMVVNAEELRQQLMEKNEMDGPVFKITDDPRITKVGRFLRKTSLDELPQFFNVLLGEMSVVGPRPPLPDEVKEYERWQLRRLSMKPGITCIWQVSGRNNIPFEEWMKMDLQYIDNWSLKLDFIIFLKTIRTMIKGDGK
ncbi:sugar transferase [Alkalitalea saponilacus]|uniref:Exopolysaccharide biosynthesis polyprenyl glycosylphosphotransferase n=1 Tax=Alkalitalea saponilacus TaxID=889453 RepID=A0A1T5FR87_9BACT|nr:sugar transferase [Alkalitalea saponilacus]ASB49469.1 UDP-phosphate galactose phosphotransferase [Alkalitalea saponilacus]SKB98627.1 exopolysaccharide biosynthesis polyprenyl glycosylphosphotransferase [Alkalitalea saponilacus]